ncbi:MAG: hypothetical protein ACT4PE_05845 [Candidatus Eiseniibacteriota bacterium]
MRVAVLALLAPWIAVAAGAQEASSPAPEVSGFSVKVSLSRTDPNVQTGASDAREYLEFFLFVDDGEMIAGGEFGVSIEGGQLIGYVLDTERPWIPLPLVNPYPGTVGQARAGDPCPSAPLCFGKMLVKPDRPGGRVALDVSASERGEAAILRCDLTTESGFAAYPAAYNGEPAAPHTVVPRTDAESAGASE